MTIASELVIKPITRIRIAHLPGSNPAAFQIVRLSDGKTSPLVSPPAPAGFPVEGQADGNLLTELRWYLEAFLDYPFPPETDHADRVLVALRSWGQQAFSALFESRIAARFFDAATAVDYSNLYLQIASDDPRVLAWPWEALYDPELGWLAQTCQIERRLNTVRDPDPVPSALPTDQVNILLVVARPYGKSDVRFRSIARPLIDLIESDHLPVRLELLRPPTFEGLRQHLREHPAFYHILHFDGHGAFASQKQCSDLADRNGEGTLVFETEAGEPDPISAEKLSLLLKEHALPGVVLNACQSAMGENGGDNPFASVATALLRSGMRDVLAMAYSLYVSAAQQFLPSFYRRLFEIGDMAAAARAGRQQMFLKDKRTSPRGDFPLQDWLLPVLYRQDPISFSFASNIRGEAAKELKPRPSNLPKELSQDEDTYGFIGRDSAVLQLERAMRRAPAGILIQGLGGAGKTTLARGFVRWLEATGGIGEGCVWLQFQEIRSAEYAFNRLGEAIFGSEFAAIPMEQKTLDLARAFNEHRFLIVWDNFESAVGVPGTSVSANLTEADRTLLAKFLEDLRGGASKVLITSRSAEEWLGNRRRFVISLGGLDREERWEYCELILRDLDLKVDRNDKKLVELMDVLGGHPLSMRIILPRLEKMTPAQVATALRSNLSALNISSDDSEARLTATLQFVQQSIPTELQPLLIPLSMHEGYLDADYLESIANRVSQKWARDQIDTLIQSLVSAGLMHDLGKAVYELHPLVTSYLRSLKIQDLGEVESWARAFVDVMGGLAIQLVMKEGHDKRSGYKLLLQSFHRALPEAYRLGMIVNVNALEAALADFASESSDFTTAYHFYGLLVKRYAELGDIQNEAVGYRNLGTVCLQQENLGAADQWFRKSLALAEELGDDLQCAGSFYQLGVVAQKRRDFEKAGMFYRTVAEIAERLGNRQIAAAVYHQLGMIAESKNELDSAESWYHKSAEINDQLGYGNGTAATYHHLGSVAEERQDFESAERWYRKSLDSSEKQGNENLAAATYHDLGIIAQRRGNHDAAAQLYRMSLNLEEKIGDDMGAAGTYAQLGILAGEKGNFIESGQWLAKGIRSFKDLGESHQIRTHTHNFLINYAAAPKTVQEKLERIWRDAGIGDFPRNEEHHG